MFFLSPKHLRGNKPVRGWHLYLKNISVDPSDTDDQICTHIRSHAKSQDLRVMNIDVIQSRYVQDTVGCKLTVPKYQAEDAKAAHTWPDYITCQDWRPYRKSSNVKHNVMYKRANGNQPLLWDKVNEYHDEYMTRFNHNMHQYQEY